jgi:hypothetical protein
MGGEAVPVVEGLRGLECGHDCNGQQLMEKKPPVVLRFEEFPYPRLNSREIGVNKVIGAREFAAQSFSVHNLFSLMMSARWLVRRVMIVSCLFFQRFRRYHAP